MSYFWKIEEAVGAGRYITLDGIYETRAAAEAEIARHRYSQDMRAELYRTGRWDGPVRASEEA